MRKFFLIFIPIVTLVIAALVFRQPLTALFTEKPSAEQSPLPTAEKKNPLSLPGEHTEILIEVLPLQSDAGKPLPIRKQDMQAIQEALIERLDSLANINQAEVEILENNKLSMRLATLDPELVKMIVSKITFTATLSIHEVHPLHNQNPFEAFALAKKVADREEIVPSYRAYPQPKRDPKTYHYLRDEHGNFLTDKYWLVKRRAALTGSDIEYAQASPHQPGMVEITLSDAGGGKMREFTMAMKQGEFIVTIVNDNVASAATLHARVLGKHFVITGQNSKAESEDLATALNIPLTNSLKVISVKIDGIKQK